MLDPAMATAAPLEGIETTAEVAVIAEVAGQPVGNEALAVVAEPMTADGLPANGRALARTTTLATATTTTSTARRPRRPCRTRSSRRASSKRTATTAG